MKFLQEMIRLREEAKTVELTTYKGKELPNDIFPWSEHVFYKGMNVFDHIYSKPFKELGEAEHWIKNDYDDADIESIDTQECYLGYSPSKDVFVMGFDGWLTEQNSDYDPDDEEGEGETIDGNCSPYIVFKVTVPSSSQPTCNVVKKDIDYNSCRAMWYAKRGGLKQVHEEYPDIIDVRLD